MKERKTRGRALINKLHSNKVRNDETHKQAARLNREGHIGKILKVWN